jgi:cytochrome c oxidase cbb3-type subunit 3
MSCCTKQAPPRMTMTKDTHTAGKLMPMPKLPCQKDCENCKEKKERKLADQLKPLLVSAMIMISILPVWAQEATTPAKTFWDDPFTHPLLPLYAVTALAFITVVLVIVVALYMLKLLNIMAQQAEAENAAKKGIAYVKPVSWWEKMWDNLNAAVPTAQEETIALDHNFDGIRELDNHLPPWWKWLFYATIIWAVIYLSVYHIAGSLPLSVDEYENELAKAEEQSRIYKASQPAAVIDENALTFTNDEAIIAKGKIVFVGNCVACHRNDGGGNSIGPNLTDNYWLHGGGIKNVFTTIKNGVVEKGMPAWGKAMSPQDVRDVAFYIMSLQGSQPQNGKAPQGELYVPEQKTDSLPAVKRDSLIVIK